ncbi:MAG: ABC transporter ATP-binding protein/permease [Candidatus Cloacimonetes bacterium]|nr:ABC transporter ATP-binding protein/permease [Candidatus Cloacimonadota bacterium]
MKNLGKIYRITLARWGNILLGLLCSLGFAVFSGVSILMVIPLLDNVFSGNKTAIQYHNFTEFRLAAGEVISGFISGASGFKELFNAEYYQPWLDKLNLSMQQADPVMLLWMVSIAFIVLTIIKNIFFYGQNSSFAYLQGYTVREMRNQLYHKYIYQSLAFFNKNRVGDSIVRMMNDIEIVGTMFIDAFFKSLQNILLIVVYMITAMSINMRLFLISIIILPLFSWLISLLGNKIKKYAKRIQAKISQMFSYVEEMLSSIRIVKAFAREKREFERFSEINDQHFHFWFRSRLYGLINVPLAELNSTLIGGLVLIIGGRLVLTPDSGFSFGSFMAFLFAIFSMLHPVKQLTTTYASLRKALVSADRIYEIMDEHTDITDTPGAIEKKTFESQIEFTGVSFSYNSNKTVLNDINLKITRGEKVALVGSSGSGKTTITNLMTRMYDTSEGEIRIDGIPLQNIKLSDLRLLFGTVTQESILFSDTVYNNIAYGSLQKIDMARAQEAARIANADEFISPLPDGYNTRLDTKAANLSGGQKQRLCIARAIAGDPPILIFDEATSALDTEAELKVQQAIEQATQARTVVMIAHRLSTILNSDRIVVLDAGKIVGIGTHQELLNSNERYQTLYRLQFEL